MATILATIISPLFVNNVQWLLTSIKATCGLVHRIVTAWLEWTTRCDGYPCCCCYPNVIRCWGQNETAQKFPLIRTPNQNLPCFCTKIFTFQGRCLKFSRFKLFIRQFSTYLWQRTQNGAPVVCFSNDASIQATHNGGIDLTTYRMDMEFW